MQIEPLRNSLLMPFPVEPIDTIARVRHRMSCPVDKRIFPGLVANTPRSPRDVGVYGPAARRSLKFCEIQANMLAGASESANSDKAA